METNKPVVMVVIIVITLTLLFLFVIPGLQESGNLQAALRQKQAQYNGQSMYYQQVTDQLRQLESKKEALDKINSALPENVSLGELVYFLQKTATESGLTSKSVVFSQAPQPTEGQILPASSDKAIKDIMLTATMSGSYQGLKKFLSTLENSARLFEVTTISFAPVNSLTNPALKNQLSVYDIKLEITTHSY